MVEAKIVSESMNICQHNDAQIEQKSSTYSALFIIQTENSNSFELLHYLLVDLCCSVNKTRWAYQFVLGPASELYSEFSCIGRLRYLQRRYVNDRRGRNGFVYVASGSSSLSY